MVCITDAEYANNRLSGYSHKALTKTEMGVLRSDVNMHLRKQTKRSRRKRRRIKDRNCLRFVFTLNDQSGLIQPINVESSHILFTRS